MSYLIALFIQFFLLFLGRYVFFFDNPVSVEAERNLCKTMLISF